MSNTKDLELELGIKSDHYARKVQKRPVAIGRYLVSERAHNEWEVQTRDGQLLDTFGRQEQAVRFAKALKGA